MRSDKQSKWYFFSWSTVLNQMQNTENKDDLKTNIWNLSYHKRTLKLFLMLGHTQKLHYIGFPQKSCSGNTCDGVSFLIRLGLQYATLFEKRFQHIFSPINLKKNFRAGFLQNSSVRIFLSTYSSEFWNYYSIMVPGKDFLNYRILPKIYFLWFLIKVLEKL